MHMKTGVEQCVYAIFLLSMLPDKAVLPGEAISQQLGTSPTYFQKLLRKLVSADLITSVPGVKGGFKLKKKQKISVSTIFTSPSRGSNPFIPPAAFSGICWSCGTIPIRAAFWPI